MSAAGSSRRRRTRPATAPALTGRRGKVVYTITAEGKERFHELVGQTGPEAYDDGGFGVRLAFFGHTAADVRLRILEGRRRTVEQQREGLRASLARTRRSSTATPSSCSGTAWSRSTARSAGSPS